MTNNSKKWVLNDLLKWFRLFNDEVNPKHLYVKTITLDECENVLEVLLYNNRQFKYWKHYSNARIMAQNILKANNFRWLN